MRGEQNFPTLVAKVVVKEKRTFIHFRFPLSFPCYLN